MNLSMWKWAAITRVIVALIPGFAFRSPSSVWRYLVALGFEVDKDQVMWPARTVIAKLWAVMIVGVIALGVQWWFS